MSQTKSRLGFFNDKLTEFFRDLAYTFPEERDIQTTVDYIDMAKKSNPKLVLDLFYENVYKEAHHLIENEDEEQLILLARQKIQKQYTEISSALSIFDKHWETLDNNNRTAIWKYLKVLCILCEKAKDAA